MQVLLSPSCESLNQLRSPLYASFSLHVKCGQHLFCMVLPGQKQFICFMVQDLRLVGWVRLSMFALVIKIRGKAT